MRKVREALSSRRASTAPSAAGKPDEFEGGLRQGPSSFAALTGGHDVRHIASQGASMPRHAALAQRAATQLEACTVRASDGRVFTKAAPKLYPHQWSWDAAFIAMGIARLDAVRAAHELESVMSGQWKNGKVPHITYNPDVPEGAYFPDAARWDCKAVAPGNARADAPDTSGIMQPPVHAIAALETWKAAQTQGPAAIAEVKRALTTLYPKLIAWHRYLLNERDPERSGLVTLFHPWESGTDNSPRWDEALNRITVDSALLPTYERADLKHADASERPTQSDYDRYLWLVELYKSAGYDDAKVYGEPMIDGKPYPFLIKDVFLSALLVEANEALAQLSDVVGGAPEDKRQLESWAARGRAGLETRWDDEFSGTTDFDVRAGNSVRVRTVANFAPLIAGKLGADRLSKQLELFSSRYFCGNEALVRKLPPSTSPLDAAYQPKKYWRGPNWPIVNWIFARALESSGATNERRALVSESLAALDAHGLYEYAHPETGEPLGSREQSWTSAFVLATVDERALPQR
nr:hypothetical protein [uncultured bacterium]